jgi:hypothetical protein
MENKMQQQSMLIRFKAGKWTAAAGLAIALVMLGGCGSVPLKVVGNEYRLTVKDNSGNIADKEAKTADERVAVLSATLRDRRKELGGENIAKDELTFLPYAESSFTLPDGSTQVLTVIYQTYKGARVIDGLQYGSFDSNSGELRSVRAFLKDPAKLPEPPKADMATWSRVHQTFRNYLQEHKATKFNFTIEEQPVISADLGVAGYLAHYSRRNADTSLSRFAAIVDPNSNAVHVLYDIGTD